MKNQVLRIFMMLSILVTLTAGSVVAQALRSKVTRIPFSFTVGKKTLPAGEYSVQRYIRNSDTVWLVQSRDGRDSVLISTNPVRSTETQEKGKLVFRRYGDRFFLSQIWTPGGNTGRELRSQQAAKELAMNVAEPQTVVIAIGSLD